MNDVNDCDYPSHFTSELLLNLICVSTSCLNPYTYMPRNLVMPPEEPKIGLDPLSCNKNTVLARPILEFHGSICIVALTVKACCILNNQCCNRSPPIASCRAHHQHPQVLTVMSAAHIPIISHRRALKKKCILFCFSPSYASHRVAPILLGTPISWPHATKGCLDLHLRRGRGLTHRRHRAVNLALTPSLHHDSDISAPGHQNAAHAWPASS